MAISGTPLFSIYFFDTFHRYNFSIYFFDIIFRYFECSQFSEKQKLSLKNYSSSSLKAKKAEKPPRTANNDMPAAKGTGGRLVAINSKAEKKETSKNIRDGKQQTLASFIIRPAVQFPPLSQPPKRKPLLPLNLPNVNVPLRKRYNIDLSKDNKNFEERKKLQGLQMDLS